jgi:hypothetical protein
MRKLIYRLVFLFRTLFVVFWSLSGCNGALFACNDEETGYNDEETGCNDVLTGAMVPLHLATEDNLHVISIISGEIGTLQACCCSLQVATLHSSLF